MAEEGTVSDFHSEQLAGYLRFAMVKRNEALREVEVSFNEALDAKLTDDDKLYTADEVTELVKGVSRAVKGDVQHELLHTAHVTALVLRQLFSQAEDILLDLHVDTSQLENQYLLQEMAAFDESREKGSGKIKPLSKVSSSAAVQHALSKNKTDAEKLKALQLMCNTLTKEKSALEAELARCKSSGGAAPAASAPAKGSTAPVAAAASPASPAKGASAAVAAASPADAEKLKAAQQQCAALTKEKTALEAEVAKLGKSLKEEQAKSKAAAAASSAPSKHAALSEEAAPVPMQAAASSTGAGAQRQQAVVSSVTTKASAGQAVPVAAPAPAAAAAGGISKETLEQLREQIELLRKSVAEEHALAETERAKAARATADLTKKLQATAPFVNMRKMLKAKNDSVRLLRDLLRKHAPNAPLPEGLEDAAETDD